ncbi:MAG: SprT family zinc-dependent metalloprotease, partial [Bacteroidota bacterium]
RWVAKHQRRFAEFVRDRPQKAYVNGETHRYLGRQYRLKVLPLEGIGQQRQQRVRLVGRYFEIHTTKPDKPTHTRALLARWFRTKAEVRLRERFVLGCERMAKYGVEPPPLQVRRMERRWGSCTASGRVLLNPRLIHTPTACIDYVVLHELCHFRHPHHGPAFYALLERVMPDWKGRKERLERIH